MLNVGARVMTDMLTAGFYASFGTSLAVLIASALLLQKTSLLSRDECFRGCVKLFLGTTSLAAICWILKQMLTGS